MGHTASPDASSIYAPRRSSRSRRSTRASRTSKSPRSAPNAGGPPSPGGGRRLTPSAVRALAARHGIRPKRSLGQHFLIEPALARRIVDLAGVEPDSHVLEVGPGLGSLTVALAESGAQVLAVERDPSLMPALKEVVGSFAHVRLMVEDAVTADWGSLLDDGSWTMVANLPYNVAVPVVMNALDKDPRIERFLIMVQREVGERLTAAAGQAPYGAVSLRVAYWSEARLIRRVPPSVFWPRPAVESVLVSLVRRATPPVDVDQQALWRVIGVSFSQRRKSMRGALRRLGLDSRQAEAALEACGIVRERRPEELGLVEFACLAERWKGLT